MTETKQSAREQMPSSMLNGSASVIATLTAADAMHAELLRQIDALMDAEYGTTKADDLGRLAKIVEDYETARWPL